MTTFGWCAAIEQADRLAEAGFDYIECPLAALSIEDDRALGERLPLYLRSPLPVRALNLFIPGGMKVVGPEADAERIRRYVRKAGETASAIGVKVVVFGSGGARAVPDGWERERAEEQMRRWLRLIAEDWRGSGVTLALEPLNRKESNLINSVAEAARLARDIGSPVVRVLADFYHMEEEREPLATIAEHRDWLAHIHIADTGRRAPGTGAYPYSEFAAGLRSIGYAGTISAECSLTGADRELEESLGFMRETFG